MNIGILTISKAQMVLGGAFIIFVIVAITIFTTYQSDNKSYTNNKTEIPLNPLVHQPDNFDQSINLTTDDAVAVADFGQRVDAVDERLTSIDQSISQLRDELSSHKNIRSETAQRLTAELQTLKRQVTELTIADGALNDTLKHIKTVMQNIASESDSKPQNDLPVAGLKLLSVSIWDDGAVAIVSLGNRKTGLSVGNFFAGLKVEDISVAEQSLTLYEPATNKLYTLYADSIVYKEAAAR